MARYMPDDQIEMTEEQIERYAEAMQDALDRRFMDPRNSMSQATYDAECAMISRWVATGRYLIEEG